MKMAFILFNDMTLLDFSGFHNAVTWLKKLGVMDDLTWDYCSDSTTVKDDRGMIVQVDEVYPDLSAYDMIFIPGGKGTQALILDQAFMAWIRTAKDVTYKVSVCTGSLVLGVAGFTKDKMVTTNPLSLDLLKPYCKQVVNARAMRDGDVYTGGGITASIDLGLFFIASITNKATVQDIQTRMDYPYFNLEE